MRHCLVTGANGFVCSNIITVLIEKGWRITALDLTFDNPVQKAWQDADITYIEGDIDSLEDQAFDAIVHGAAITATPEAMGISPISHLRANLDPTLKIIEYAERNSIARTIVISSTGVYREFTSDVMTEDDPATPLGMYAIAKDTTEHLTETLRVIYHRDIVCIRLGNVYGPNEFARASRPFTSVIGRMVSDAVNADTINIYTREVEREWTYAPDIGEAVHIILTKPELKYHLYNVVSSFNATSTEIAENIKSALPSARIMKHDDVLNATRPQRRSSKVSNTRLVEETAFTAWTPMDAGVRQTIAAYQEVKKNA